jgi:hypothetical protein
MCAAKVRGGTTEGPREAGEDDGAARAANNRAGGALALSRLFENFSGATRSFPSPRERGEGARVEAKPSEGR